MLEFKRTFILLLQFLYLTVQNNIRTTYFIILYYLQPRMYNIQLCEELPTYKQQSVFVSRQEEWEVRVTKLNIIHFLNRYHIITLRKMQMIKVTK